MQTSYKLICFLFQGAKCFTVLKKLIVFQGDNLCTQEIFKIVYLLNDITATRETAEEFLQLSLEIRKGFGDDGISIITYKRELNGALKHVLDLISKLAFFHFHRESENG